MIDILSIQDYLSIDTFGYEEGDQFLILKDSEWYEENEDGEKYRFIDKVKRIKDDQIFVASQEVFIYERFHIMHGIKMRDEIFIESFEGDRIHLNLSAYRHSEDYKFCAGEALRCEINDLEEKCGELLEYLYVWFSKHHPNFPEKN